MKLVLVGILVFGLATAGLGQRSMLDVQPPPVILKTVQEKAGNRFMAGATLLAVSGIVGIITQDRAKSGQLTVIGARNLQYAQNGAVILGSGLLISGAAALLGDE